MSEHTDPTATDLVARIAAVETELELVKAAIRSSITTDRLAVVDELGRERITMGVDGHGIATLMVRTWDRRGDSTGVDISAGAITEWEPNEASITLLLHGDSISAWQVHGAS